MKLLTAFLVSVSFGAASVDPVDEVDPAALFDFKVSDVVRAIEAFDEPPTVSQIIRYENAADDCVYFANLNGLHAGFCDPLAMDAR
mgnify:CR=1 FL=1